MIRVSFICTFILTSLTVICQDYIGSDFLHIKPHGVKGTYWQNDFSHLDSSFSYQDGKLKAVRVLEGDRKFNLLFDESNRVISKIEIVTEFRVDSSFVLDIDDGCKFVINRFYTDVPNGIFEYKTDFQSYYQDNDTYKLTTGHYDMGTQVGEWTFRDPRYGVKVTLQLDKNGSPNGHYTEVYIDNGQIKWTGQYKARDTNDLSTEHLFIEHVPSEKGRIALFRLSHIGVWKRYNKKGKLTDEITFKRH